MKDMKERRREKEVELRDGKLREWIWREEGGRKGERESRGRRGRKEG